MAVNDYLTDGLVIPSLGSPGTGIGTPQVNHRGAPVPRVPFGLGPIGSGSTSPSANPPQLQFTFDTIGQIIPISIGHGRLGLKTIWVAGVDGSTSGSASSGGVTAGSGFITTTADAAAGDNTLTLSSVPSDLSIGSPLTGVNVVGAVSYGTTVTNIVGSTITFNPPLGANVASGSVVSFATLFNYQGADSGLPIIGLGSVPSAGFGSGAAAPTITFAAALCHPIDPEEIGNIIAVFDGSTQTYSLDDGGLTLPPDWTVTQQQQLVESMGNAIVYPGTEGQEPAPLIVADRGTAVTNAFRGLRYIIFINYPIVGSGGTALPRISIVWQRTNSLPRTSGGSNVTAVTFAAGSG